MEARATVFYPRSRLVTKEAGVPLVYCNCIAGNDQLIFDGGSLAFDASGEVFKSLQLFKEECVTVDLNDKKLKTSWQLA